MNTKQRVLITALGTMNCTTIVSELRKFPNDYYLIGADINPAYCIATSKEVDEFYEFPYSTRDREGYFSFVYDFCKEHHIDIYYCVVDEEVETMSKHRDELASIGVKLCIANTDAVIIAHNKDKFAEWSEKNIPSCCIKRYSNYSDIKDSDFPLFIKPIEGRASIGCRIISNRAELQSIVDCWDEYVVQEYISSTKIVAVDVVRNRMSNQIEIAQRLELLRNSNGCGVAVEIIDNQDIREICFDIADKLNLHGCINMEFFLTEKGPRIIEINPRLPAGIAYSCMAGLDIVMNALRIAEGAPCSFTPIRVGAHFAKRYETIEI